MKNETINYNDMFKNYPDVVNLDELMQMLKIGKTLAYKLINNKKLPAIKIGREYKITKLDIIEYIVNKKQGQI